MRPIRPAGLCIAMILIACLTLLSGCAKKEGGIVGSHPTWEIVLDLDGREVKIPLSRLNVFLTDNDAYPETFELEGEGLLLVGSFPSDLRVGYGEEWENMFGREIKILPQGGEYGREKDSFITLPGGERKAVKGGDFSADKRTGKYSGSQGNLTLHGKISIIIQSGDEWKILTGTFAVQCVTWG